MKKRFNIWTEYAIFDITVTCQRCKFCNNAAPLSSPHTSLHSHSAFGVALRLTEGTVKFSVMTNEDSLVTREQIWVQTGPRQMRTMEILT